MSKEDSKRAAYDTPLRHDDARGAGGFAVGIAIGVAIGIAMKNLAFGIAIGVALGVAFSARGRNSNRP